MVQIDMGMPKCCADCPIRTFGLYRESHCSLEYWRILDDKYTDDDGDRPEWCPLQEVQE